MARGIEVGDVLTTLDGRAVQVTRAGWLINGLLDDGRSGIWVSGSGLSLIVGLPDLDFAAPTPSGFSVLYAEPTCRQHDPVDTGMQVSWCKRCDRKLRFDFPDWRETE